VTGGLGFIGSNLAHTLVELGADLTLVDSLPPEFGGDPRNVEDIRDRVRVVVGDIQDEAVMAPLLPEQDYLFNLAAQVGHAASLQDPLRDLGANTVSHVALLESCRRLNPGIRIVHAGTRQIYGRPQRLPVDETHPLAPLDFNGISKLAGEWYHCLYHRIHGLRTTSLRMTNVYGPRMYVRDGRKNFIGLWVRQLVEGQELTIFGDGSQVRDLNYVDDVIAALLLCAAAPQAVGQIYNLGAGPVSLLELAREMIAANDGGAYRLEPFPPERKKIDIGDYYADFGKIRAQLGWSPRVPLGEGLRRTLAHFRRVGLGDRP
jgi:nucleoside-diphosphate-sugar epimerase